MEKRQELFLSIIRAAIWGQSAREPEELTGQDCEALLTLAQDHRILPLFYEAVHTWDAFRLLPQAEQTRQLVRRQVMAQTLRTSGFAQLNEQLRQAGLKPLVVKGIVCRSLYPHPDHRPSGDEDVWIGPQELESCRAKLEELGLEAGAGDGSYEIPYRKPGSALYIELHSTLFPPDSRAYGAFNRFFRDARQRAVLLETAGGAFWTMEPTDHLLYLLLHAFKHFVHSGFGIRQLCDIVLFASRYGREIQWQRVVEGCRQARAERFAVALFSIGEAYLGFDPAVACYPAQWHTMSVDIGPMLEDLLSGGLYGDNTRSRLHSSRITLDAAAAAMGGKKPRARMLPVLFPPARSLWGRYPYLKEKPWLLPVAWCSRLARYHARTHGDPDNSPAQALRIGKSRVALLRQYEIIP